jgi:hypothetical protein
MSARAPAAWMLPAAVVLLAVGCAIGLFRTVSTIDLTLPFDPNEGWNAYHAAAAMAGGSPYTPPQSFMTNNYPPLSFYIVGTLGRALGDMIIAGRLLSLAAFLAVMGAIAAALRMMACSLTEAAFGALVLAACLLLNSDYVGMDDPQLLGHAVAMAALLLVLRPPRDALTLASAALLFTLAFFIKHNLIVLPLAVTAWLALYDRWSAIRLAIAGVAFLAVGLIAFRLVYGFDLLGVLHSARTFALHDLAINLSSWLIWGLLPLLIAAVLFAARRDDKFAVLCALYASIGFLVGASYFGGAGVDVNAMFDADIALALVAGLALNQLSRHGAVYTSAIVAAFLLPLAIGTWINSSADWLSKDYWLHPMRDETVLAKDDIAFLRTHNGPALCEMLAYCYWAVKAPEVDVFNTGQQFATQSRSDESLVRMILAHRFAAMQLDALSPFALGDRVHRTLDRAYRIDHTNDDGVFLVPR